MIKWIIIQELPIKTVARLVDKLNVLCFHEFES